MSGPASSDSDEAPQLIPAAPAPQDEQVTTPVWFYLPNPPPPPEPLADGLPLPEKVMRRIIAQAVPLWFASPCLARLRSISKGFKALYEPEWKKVATQPCFSQQEFWRYVAKRLRNEQEDYTVSFAISVDRVPCRVSITKGHAITITFPDEEHWWKTRSWEELSDALDPTRETDSNLLSLGKRIRDSIYSIWFDVSHDVAVDLLLARQISNKDIAVILVKQIKFMARRLFNCDIRDLLKETKPIAKGVDLSEARAYTFLLNGAEVVAPSLGFNREGYEICLVSRLREELTTALERLALLRA